MEKSFGVLWLLLGIAVWLIHKKLNVIMEMLEEIRDRDTERVNGFETHLFTSLTSKWA